MKKAWELMELKPTVLILVVVAAFLFYQVPILKDKIRRLLDSWYAIRFGKRQKKIRQAILLAIDRNGPVTEDTLKEITKFPAEEVSMKLSDLIWCRWAEKSVTLNKESAIHYVITDKGKRQLANPGSTDHEEL